MSKVFATSKDYWQDFLTNGNADTCRVSKDGQEYIAIWNGLTNLCHILDDENYERVDQLVLEPDWDEDEGRYYERHFDERSFPECGYVVTHSRKQWVRDFYNL